MRTCLRTTRTTGWSLEVTPEADGPVSCSRSLLPPSRPRPVRRLTALTLLSRAELDLLALFSDDAPAPASQLQQAMQPQQQPSGVVPAAAYAAPAVAVTAVAPAQQPVAVAQTVQQVQLQAIMQQQMAVQQQPQQYAGAAALPQDLAQLQQYQAAQMQAMLAAQASLRQGQPVNKRGKVSWLSWACVLSGLQGCAGELELRHVSANFIPWH